MMRTVFWARLGVLLTLLLALPGCSTTYNWNQRYKVVIATPEGEVTAEAVQAVEIVYHRIQINGFARSYSQRGEAVVADLGAGQFVFVLLGAADQAEDILPHDIESRKWPRAFHEIERMVDAGFYDLDINEVNPRLVTFGNISDPTTIKVLDKTNLAATLGVGYALVSLQIEITTDPVTLGAVDDVLPWLEKRGREFSSIKGLPPKEYAHDEPDAQDYSVEPTAFTTELYK